METKKLNLNIKFYKNQAYIEIFIVEGINQKGIKYELGIFTNEDEAEKIIKYYKEIMKYKDVWCCLDIAWL